MSIVEKYNILLEQIEIHSVDFILPLNNLAELTAPRDKDKKIVGGSKGIPKKTKPYSCGFFSSLERASLQYRALCSKTSKLAVFSKAEE